MPYKSDMESLRHSTNLPIEETAAICRVNLLAFAQVCFEGMTKQIFATNHHHESICNALGRVVAGECPRLIINLPPRYSKTELAVVSFIAWCLGNFPDSEFIHCSYGQSLARLNSHKTRSLVESEIYRKIFPRVRLAEDTTAKSDWATIGGGKLYATGAGGSITGYGAGKLRGGKVEAFGGAIVIDDPHKPSEILSDTKREGILSWYNSTLASRTNSPATPIVVIMQRLHEDDLSGFLLKGGSGEEWEHVCIPALSEDGEALWAFKHTAKRLEAMKKTDPYVFSGQYQQRPAPLGGGVFKADWWKYYSVAPPFEWTAIFADTACKTKNHNDFTVIQLWGMSKGNIYLVDQVRGRFESPQLRTNLIAFYNKHSINRLRCVYIEDAASGIGLIQNLKQDDKQAIPVEGIKRTTDKVTRAYGAAPFISSGYVYLPENAAFLSDFLYEASQFTPQMSHKHDDQVDCMMDAIDKMLRPPVKFSGVF